MVVPKIIHQTWKNHEIPEHWKISQEEWKRLHPGWVYKLWTDEDNRNLIKNKYSWFLPIYDAYPHVIQRVDVARYFILYEYGGVYSDLDIYPIKPIDEYVSGTEEAYFSLSSNYRCFTNSIMASKKGAPFWLEVFEELKIGKIPFPANLSRHFTIMCTTGPMMLDKVILKHYNTLGFLPVGFRNYATNERIDLANLKPNTITLPLVGSSWCGFDSFCFMFFNKYKSELAVLGIIAFILLIIIGLYLIYNYRGMYKTCEMKLSKKCPMKRK